MTAPTPFRWVSGAAHGPLPVLLLVMTTTTGLVDAVSVLGLGRVFVANMTGNVVFLGFALAASLAALAGFLVGAALGGVLVGVRSDHRGRLLRDATAAETVLLAVAAVLLVPVTGPPTSLLASVVAGLAAIALGLQNSVVRHLAVPDLTTTVLTMTLTGVAADIRRAGRLAVTRGVLAVATMFAGALVGGLLVLHTRLVWPFVLVVVLLGAVSVTTALLSRRPAPWHAGHGRPA